MKLIARWTVLVLGLCTAPFGARAGEMRWEPSQLTMTVTPNRGLSYTWLLYSATVSFGIIGDMVPIGDLTGGVPTTLTVDFTRMTSGALAEYFTIAGVYDVPNGYITVGMSPEQAALAIGTPFSIPFTCCSEADVANALVNGNNVDLLINFMQSSLIPMPMLSNNAGQVTLVDFSTGAMGGSASFFTADEDAPEPGTLTLLGGGLALVCGARLRRSRRSGR
jgi:hypothetical protein